MVPNPPSRFAPAARWRAAGEIHVAGAPANDRANQCLERVLHQHQFARGVDLALVTFSRTRSADFDATDVGYDVVITGAADHLCLCRRRQRRQSLRRRGASPRRAAERRLDVAARLLRLGYGSDADVPQLAVRCGPAATPASCASVSGSSRMPSRSRVTSWGQTAGVVGVVMSVCGYGSLEKALRDKGWIA